MTANIAGSPPTDRPVPGIADMGRGGKALPWTAWIKLAPRLVSDMLVLLRLGRAPRSLGEAGVDGAAHTFDDGRKIRSRGTTETSVLKHEA